jgi:hypothetical protein
MADIIKNSTDQMVVCPLSDTNYDLVTATVTSLTINMIINNGSDVNLVSAGATLVYSSSAGGHKLVIPAASITASGRYEICIKGSNIRNYNLDGLIFLPPVVPHILSYNSSELDTLLQNI